MLRFTFATLIACLLAGLVSTLAWSEEQPAWKHDVIVSNPGTRSEGHTGVLTYGDHAILPYFSQLDTPVGRFLYINRRFRWGDAGWVKQEGDVPAPDKLDEAIAPEELERGWYTCEAGKTKPGTPEHWFWTPTFNTWIDPAKIDAYVQDHFGKADWLYVVKQGEGGGVTSSLTYKGTAIPQSVHKILTPIGDFYVPEGQMGPTGWMIFSGEVLDEWPAGENELDDETIGKGLFDESVEMTGVAIPEHWVYLPDKKWWIDPAKIGEHFKDTPMIRPVIHGGRTISKEE